MKAQSRCDIAFPGILVYIVFPKNLFVLMIVKFYCQHTIVVSGFQTERHMQTVQALIRLLLEEQTNRVSSVSHFCIVKLLVKIKTTFLATEILGVLLFFPFFEGIQIFQMQ